MPRLAVLHVELALVHLVSVLLGVRLTSPRTSCNDLQEPLPKMSGVVPSFNNQ